MYMYMYSVRWSIYLHSRSWCFGQNLYIYIETYILYMYGILLYTLSYCTLETFLYIPTWGSPWKKKKKIWHMLFSSVRLCRTSVVFSVQSDHQLHLFLSLVPAGKTMISRPTLSSQLSIIKEPDLQIHGAMFNDVVLEHTSRLG